MRAPIFPAICVVLTFGPLGCTSMHDKDVKSSYYSQWTSVRADVKSTVKAGEAVFAKMELRDVKSDATALDGSIDGNKSDGSSVHVKVKRVNESTTEVSVKVGTIGDPVLGADIARQIKDRAEAKSPATQKS